MAASRAAMTKKGESVSFMSASVRPNLRWRTTLFSPLIATAFSPARWRTNLPLFRGAGGPTILIDEVSRRHGARHRRDHRIPYGTLSCGIRAHEGRGHAVTQSRLAVQNVAADGAGDRRQPR